MFTLAIPLASGGFSPFTERTLKSQGLLSCYLLPHGKSSQFGSFSIPYFSPIRTSLPIADGARGHVAMCPNGRK